MSNTNKQILEALLKFHNELHRMSFGHDCPVFEKEIKRLQLEVKDAR